MSQLSVLVCTYNRPDLLRQALHALIDRTTERPDQVVVVNGGDGRADRVVDEFANRQGVAVELVKTVNKNLAASRNVGLPRCTGDIIAMTDDDAEVFPDWVTQMKRTHANNPKAGAIGGPVLGMDSDSLVSRISDQVTFPKYPTARAVRTLPGVNISYKRKVVDKIGLQDETLFRGEDVDYNWRLLKEGYEIVFDPAIKVNHHHRPTLRGFLNQHYMYGRAYYLVRRKWPEMYCVYPHSLASVKDLLKAANFIAGIFYEPVFAAAKMETVPDKLLAYPLLLANQVAWRSGMIRQRLLHS